MIPRRLSLCLLALHATAVSVAAQTPAAPAAPASAAWQQLESTYQNELKKIHIPLLSSYVNDLTRLAAQSRSAEATVAINRELKEMQAIITSGGVVDLGKPPGTVEPPAPAGPPAPPRAKGDSLLSLTPDSAREVTPAPGTPVPQTVTAQKLAWTVETLPAGKYEVICQGGITALDTPASLTLQAGDQLLKFPFAKRHIAADSGSLRLIRIGVLDLPADVSQMPLILAIDSPSANLVFRQLLFTRPTPPKPPAP